MSNLKEVIPLTVNIERFFLRDALKVITHSILFHRNFSLVKPAEGSFSFITKAEDAETDALVEQRVQELLQNFDSAVLHLIIRFYTKKETKWFNNSDEIWEEWIVSINITRAKTEREQIQAKSSLETDLHTLMLQISGESGKKRDHIPPILNADPFPFQITFQTPSNQGPNWKEHNPVLNEKDFWLCLGTRIIISRDIGSSGSGQLPIKSCANLMKIDTDMLNSIIFVLAATASVSASTSTADKCGCTNYVTSGNTCYCDAEADKIKACLPPTWPNLPASANSTSPFGSAPGMPMLDPNAVQEVNSCINSTGAKPKGTTNAGFSVGIDGMIALAALMLI